MNQPMDHLRSKKKPIKKTIWVAGDSELADEFSELEASLSRAEGALASLPATSPRREAAASDVLELTAKVAELKAQLRETSIKFTFQSLGRKRYEKILADHPPTDEQVKAHKDSGEAGAIEFNPDTFPYALISHSCIEPLVNDENREEFESWIRDSDDWNGAEVITLFQTAMAVNTSRRLVNMGKDSTGI